VGIGKIAPALTVIGEELIELIMVGPIFGLEEQVMTVVHIISIFTVLKFKIL
jgi:hypothetical protein